MKASNDSGAFIDPDLTISGKQQGPLQGLTFAIKDLYDVGLSPAASISCAYEAQGCRGSQYKQYV